MIDPEYLGQRLIERGFRVWFKYMFKAVENRPFIEEELHKGLFDAFDKVTNIEILRLILNLPPRSSKTTLAIYFMAFHLAKNKRCNFIYTSYSQDLLSQISKILESILSHPIYTTMYKNSYSRQESYEDPINDFWKEYLFETTGKDKFSARKIITSEGGVILFSSIGSAITGFGAGIRGSKEFSGCIFCFGYETLVKTNIGFVRIGDIVEKKMDVLIYSFNHKKHTIELKPIDRYIKNENSEMVELTLSNGDVIECTPEHKFYTKSRGYVEAQNLTPNDVFFQLPHSFEPRQSEVIFFHYIFSFYGWVTNLFKLFVGKTLLCSRLIINIFNRLLPVFSLFNAKNSSRSNSIFFADRANCSPVFSDIDSVFFGNLCTRMCLSHRKSFDFNRVFHVFGFGAITKIRKIVIQRISVNVPNLNTFLLWANKRLHVVFSGVYCLLENFSNKPVFNFCSAVGNNSVKASGPSKIRNLVKPFISNDIFPLFINKIHNKTSYCLSVRDNCNLFIQQSQPILVHNCDDANKPSDVRSERMRDRVRIYYQETLLSRVNDSNIPIINIQQRLHLEDLSGILKEIYDFKVITRPLIDKEGKCTLPSQYTEQRLKEIMEDQYVFNSQYQQNPIKLGGNIIKSEWYQYYPISFLNDVVFEKLFMTGDTAMKTKEHNDFSVFCLWGVFVGKLYLIDLIRDKWEAPELEKEFKKFWNKWHLGIKGRAVSSVFIEDKASGTGLIQKIKKDGFVPVIGMEVEKDKLTRLEDVLTYIQSGCVFLPVDETYSFNKKLIKESEEFSRDLSHKHDDIVDNIIYGIEKGIAKRKISILDNL